MSTLKNTIREAVILATVAVLSVAALTYAYLYEWYNKDQEHAARVLEGVVVFSSAIITALILCL